ncbi:MAG: hypothetical protein JJ892_03850 [Balneola sp.]|nr:hypothetical protein [Balneola sp.]MBO6710704.1 hypothetical protein [Balneola sp.]MBO6799390.1 hypothetical protein [Balneola sp.]MBO6869481.1 hypothetical protein [Balneola sp.]
MILTYFKILTVTLLLTSCAPYITEREPPKPYVTTSPLFKPAVYPRLAILVIDNTRRFRSYQGALRQIEDEFMRSALNRGYTVAARSDIDEVLDELNLQRSNLTEKEIAEAGLILNVPAILIVNINNASTERYYPSISVQGARYYSTTVSVSARLISAELAEVMWISSYTGNYKASNRSRENEVQALPIVARIVASGLPRR